MTLWVVGLAVSTLLGLGTGQLARSRGRSGLVWSVAGVVIWPVALSLLLLLPNRSKARAPKWGTPFVLAGVFVASWAVLSLLVNGVAIKDFYVPSGAMLPTLPIGTYVDANLLDTGAQRGAVIILRLPPAISSPLVGTPGRGFDVVKRVVGIGGDTISCCHAGHVVLDGRSLFESYVPADSPEVAFGPTHVARGSIFVMGDNRGDSADSRAWGPLPTYLIVGRVEGPHGVGARVLPLGLPAAAAMLITVMALAVMTWRRPSGAAKVRVAVRTEPLSEAV